MDAYGTSVNINSLPLQPGMLRLPNPPEEYTFTPTHLLSRWGILLGYMVVCLALTAWQLHQRGCVPTLRCRSGRSAAAPLRRPSPPPTSNVQRATTFPLSTCNVQRATTFPLSTFNPLASPRASLLYSVVLYMPYPPVMLLRRQTMRLVTYRDSESVHLGALRGDEVVSLADVAPDMLSLIDAGPAGLEAARAAVERGAGVPLSTVTLLAPIPRPRQNVICLGMNYVAHTIESYRARGREPKMPEYPVFFTKAAHTVCGPDDDIPLDPKVTNELDYEVELAFIIGKAGMNVPRDEAMEYVFGYTIVNDISARDLQSRHQQFFKGKSLYRACPMGPCIVTTDEIPNPAGLGIRLRLNGETRQDSHTGDLIFDIPAIIEHLSLGMPLEPGMIVATGTPAGVGLGRTPPEYMRPGDVMEAEIDSIGILRNRIVGVA
jgi:2-keto-4-pentenoate hydratase/2-oxohepta-3-ene-1,7-dioic acid hydratase in catechol pathway